MKAKSKAVYGIGNTVIQRHSTFSCRTSDPADIVQRGKAQSHGHTGARAREKGGGKAAEDRACR